MNDVIELFCVKEGCEKDLASRCVNNFPTTTLHGATLYYQPLEVRTSPIPQLCIIMRAERAVKC
ncbi:hypothetical protein BHYA_0091g00060 [Botrytis hyacinthi]|uniref:Uncharacterized protein n=1 Tax=Botrytis hyacinthi TaxID=278943 RepID=A0A4Z1GL88_9HELO|nr:hypothetical protein BHYA_0091g00060 [Botrytis hyacinthi]